MGYKRWGKIANLENRRPEEIATNFEKDAFEKHMWWKVINHSIF